MHISVSVTGSPLPNVQDDRPEADGDAYADARSVGRDWLGETSGRPHRRMTLSLQANPCRIAEALSPSRSGAHSEILSEVRSLSSAGPGGPPRTVRCRGVAVRLRIPARLTPRDGDALRDCLHGCLRGHHHGSPGSRIPSPIVPFGPRPLRLQRAPGKATHVGRGARRASMTLSRPSSVGAQPNLFEPLHIATG